MSVPPIAPAPSVSTLPPGGEQSIAETAPVVRQDAPDISRWRGGEEVRGIFLVRKLELRTARNGQPFLDAELSNRSGAVSAKRWDAPEGLYQRLVGQAFVEVLARVQIFRDQPQLNLQSIEPAEVKDARAADFLPHTPHDVEALLAKLEQRIAALGNRWVRALLERILAREGFRERLRRAPAAMTFHHAYLGGLLEHVVSLLSLGDAVCDRYPILDRDIVAAGVILHDIGKVEELTYEQGFGYSTPGQLVGHMQIGIRYVEDAARELEGFPATLRDLIVHLILAHHGRYEFGSPKLPMTAEALAVSMIDNLDAKLWAFQRAIEDQTVGGAEWTAPQKVFDGMRLLQPASWRETIQ